MEGNMDPNPLTKPIDPPALRGALAVLQFTPNPNLGVPWPHEVVDAVVKAATEVATYHAPTGNQAERHSRLSQATAAFLMVVVEACPPGPERSTAISRIREGKMWASAAVALEGV